MTTMSVESSRPRSLRSSEQCGDRKVERRNQADADLRPGVTCSQLRVEVLMRVPAGIGDGDERHPLFDEAAGQQAAWPRLRGP